MFSRTYLENGRYHSLETGIVYRARKFVVEVCHDLPQS